MCLSDLDETFAVPRPSLSRERPPAVALAYRQFVCLSVSALGRLPAHRSPLAP